MKDFFLTASTIGCANHYNLLSINTLMGRKKWVLGALEVEYVKELGRSLH